MSQDEEIIREIPSTETQEFADAEDNCEITAETDPLAQISEDIKALSEEVGKLRNDDRALCEIEKIQQQLSEISEKLKADEQPAEKQDPAEELSALVRQMMQKQESNERKLAQALRENANFQIQVRSGMQHDLDDLKKRVSGEQLIPILKEISEMYVDYIFLTECDLTAEEMKKNLSYMFSQLEDLFEENGASVLVSSEGSPRKNYCCRVVEKIPTADPDKHNTVARSRKPGIIRDKTVLQPEYADIYVYDPSLEAEKTNDSKNEEVKK